MIIYELQCHVGHRFEGWFPNVKSFENQLEHKMVTCSVCGSYEIQRVPTGAYISKDKGLQTVPSSAVPSSQDALRVSAQSTPHLTTNVDPLVLMKAVHHYIQNNCKNVGKDFTEKAIQMHQGQIPKESIYGQATEKDREKLDEEGIDYSLVPKLPEKFEN